MYSVEFLLQDSYELDTAEKCPWRHNMVELPYSNPSYIVLDKTCWETFMYWAFTVQSYRFVRNCILVFCSLSLPCNAFFNCVVALLLVCRWLAVKWILLCCDWLNSKILRDNDKRTVYNLCAHSKATSIYSNEKKSSQTKRWSKSYKRQVKLHEKTQLLEFKKVSAVFFI